MIFKDQLGIEQQTANQRRLAIIYAAAGQKTQQVFVLVLIQVREDIGFNQFRCV